MSETTEKKPDAYFMAFRNGKVPRYPCWRYHDNQAPIIVNNKNEDEEAKAKGFHEVTDVPTTASPPLIDWFWDFEDLSAKQLSVYAVEEFGVDFPESAGEERLLAAILHLSRMAPKNSDRTILMAHTIKMNYEESLATIRKMAATGTQETTKEVFYA